MTPRPFLLGNRSVSTTETAEVRNPYNGALIAEICVAGAKEINEALDLAARTFEEARHAAPVLREERSGRAQKLF